MNYVREKLCGAKYKKIAQEKSKKEEKIISQISKLRNFFAKKIDNSTNDNAATRKSDTDGLVANENENLCGNYYII